VRRDAKADRFAQVIEQLLLRPGEHRGAVHAVQTGELSASETVQVALAQQVALAHRESRQRVAEGFGKLLGVGKAQVLELGIFGRGKVSQQIRVGPGLGIFRALFVSGQKKEALEEEDKARMLISDAYPTQAEEAALERDEVGGMLEELGRIEEARKSYESARFNRTVIDTENPRRLISDVRLGALLFREGRARESARSLEQTLEQLQKLHGKFDPLLVWPLRTLAQARTAARDYRAALRALERAQSIVLSHHGHSSPLSDAIHVQMGEVMAAAGDRKAALQHYDDAHLPLASAFG
jgi:tetratricopeptide (TPR) repeat protein